MFRDLTRARTLFSLRIKTCVFETRERERETTARDERKREKERGDLGAREREREREKREKRERDDDDDEASSLRDSLSTHQRVSRQAARARDFPLFVALSPSREELFEKANA